MGGRRVRPPAARAGPLRALAWASLLPLALVLRPYGGLMQDARIYIGQGVAAGDPAGLGRDMVFANDAQTRFSALRPAVGALLAVTGPGTAALLLAAAGSALWLAAAVALARRVAPGRAAWALVVAVLALPAGYGAFDAFSYAEPLATPRIFAESAVLAALAALLDGRRLPALALLGVALALHPLMAMPGVALAGLVLAGEDRRWLLPFAAAAAAVILAAALGAPLLRRLFEPFDAAWLAVLRARNVNLFPTLWPGEAYGRIACRAAAALVAASLCAGRVRALLRAGVAVGLGGVAVSLLFGDVVPGVLVAQLQPWRALWLLGLLGNAGLAFAALRLWRGSEVGRIALAALVLAWCCADTPALSIPLAAAAVWLQARAARGGLPAPPRRAARLALLAALAVAGCTVLAEAAALASLLRAGSGGTPWPFVLGSGVAGLPLAAGAVALALAPPRALHHPAALPGAALGAVALCLVAVAVADGRSGERRMLEARTGADALAQALGPGTGEVLWIDEDSETWFLARRPAFFDALQGAPILFSRDLALEWADRGRMLSGLGLVRPRDLAPWTGAAGADEIALSPAALAGFCADRRRPAALVAPGAQLAAVPPGWTAALWRPPVPVMRLAADAAGLRWRAIDAFTVVRCPNAPFREADPLKSVSVD